VTKFSGTFQGQTSGGGNGWKAAAVVVAAALVLSGGGGAAAAAAGIAAAVVDLLYWVAGVFYGTAALAGLAWFATRRQRAVKRARDIAALEVRRQARADEIEQRHLRRAIAAERARAEAWAPLVAAFAAAVRQPEPGPARIVRGEVER
jgi:hypothetical protein